MKDLVTQSGTHSRYKETEADSMGMITWTKAYGGVEGEEGMSVKQTADSGFVTQPFFMPATLEFRISPTKLSRPLPRSSIELLHANVYEWIKVADVAVATHIHNELDRKPFTVTNLVQANRNTEMHFRLNLLRDYLLPILREGLNQRPFFLVVRDLVDVCLRRLSAARVFGERLFSKSCKALKDRTACDRSYHRI